MLQYNFSVEVIVTMKEENVMTAVGIQLGKLG